MTKVVKRLLSDKFIQGGFFLTLANFTISFFNYLFSSFAAKKLGPIGFGELSAVVSYLTVSTVFLGVVSTLIIKKIGESVDQKISMAQKIEHWFLRKLRYWQILIFISFLLTPLFGRLTNLPVLASVSLLILFYLSLINMLYSSLMQGLHLFSSVALFTVLGAIIKLLGIPLIYWFNWDLPVLYFCIIFDFSITFYLCKVTLNRYFAKKLNSTLIYDNRIINQLKKPQNYLPMLSLLSFSFYSNLDITLSKKFFIASDAGLYAGWALFAKIVSYLVGPFISVSLIFFTDQSKKNKHLLVLIILLFILLFIGIFVYLAYSLIGNFLVGLIFNQQFFKIVPFLPLAAIFGFCYLIVTVLNNYFIAKQSKAVLLNTLLVPFYLFALLASKKSLPAFIKINLNFGIILVIFYLLAFVVELIRKKRV